MIGSCTPTCCSKSRSSLKRGAAQANKQISRDRVIVCNSDIVISVIYVMKMLGTRVSFTVLYARTSNAI